MLVPLQPEQHRLYERALRSLIVDLRGVDDATFQRNLSSYLARRMALLQICSHPAMVTSTYSETPAKHLALDMLLSNLVEQRKEKVIIWSCFRFAIEQIVARYGRYSPVRYDGSVGSVDDRREAVRKFQEDDQTWLFVGNPAAAGAGLTLHRAHIAIYESMSNQAAHYLQSLDRIHRRGQVHEVEYLLLLADGTIEQEQYGGLLEKERRAQALLGDRVDPPLTRERLLEDLICSAERMTSFAEP